jgi:hypothetical protein
VIKSFQALLAVLLALATTCACAADAGIYTIVDGDVRVLRGTLWFRLAPGARAQEGDIIDASEHAQVQLETSGGAAVNMQGAAPVYLAALPAVDDKAQDATEMIVQRGWFKVSAPGKRPLRLRLPALTVELADAIVVLHGDAGAVELFVESGTTKASVPVVRGKPAPPRDVKTGEFLSRAGDRAPLTAGRAPQAFLSAMPREFRDALPVLTAHFPRAPELVAGREVTLAEAEPWLSGANRRVFVKRFTPRLGDPAFRAGVSARPAAFPEWDRVLHPEKYRPKDQDNKAN